MLDSQHASHAHEDDLKKYIHGRLDAVHCFVVGHHLLTCRKCREYLSVCIDLEHLPNPMGNARSDQMNRRSEPRFNIGDKLVYRELSPFCMELQKVSIMDISKNGVGVLAANPVLPGTIVQIQLMSTNEIGQVRHCRAFGDNDYQIGLRLHEGF